MLKMIRTSYERNRMVRLFRHACVFVTPKTRRSHSSQVRLLGIDELVSKRPSQSLHSIPDHLYYFVRPQAVRGNHLASAISFKKNWSRNESELFKITYGWHDEGAHQRTASAARKMGSVIMTGPANLKKRGFCFV